MAVHIQGIRFQLNDFKFGPKDFDFNDHGLYLFRGKNGSGKTSLLRCLLGRIRKSGGIIQGLQFPIATCGIESLFIKSWTVSENTNWLSKLGSFSPPTILASNEADRQRFDHLSLGQKRQAELNFALNTPFKTIFLDEPFTHLDSDRLLDAAHRIQKASESKLILMTSHHEVASLKFAGVFEL